MSLKLCSAVAALALAAPATFAAPAAPAPAKPAATTAPATTASKPQPLTTEEAIAYIKGVTAQATAALTDKSIPRAKQIEKFRVVLSDALALDFVGKFVLGSARKTMTPAQIARYDAAFPPYITRQYAEQFDEIVGRPLVVKEAAVVKTSRTGDVFVRTQFTRSAGAPINVDWRVRKLASGKSQLVDIVVSGVSIMTVRREEFAAFIKQNGVDALIGRLEQDAKKPA